LRGEIWLSEKEVAATTVGRLRPRLALEVWALRNQSLFWPQSAFPNNPLHALKPAGHGGVVIWEVKILKLARG